MYIIVLSIVLFSKDLCQDGRHSGRHHWEKHGVFQLAVFDQALAPGRDSGACHSEVAGSNPVESFNSSCDREGDSRVDSVRLRFPPTLHYESPNIGY
jgi:hypothetical protein